MIWNLDDDDKYFNCAANKLNRLSVNSPHGSDVIQDDNGSALVPI